MLPVGRLAAVALLTLTICGANANGDAADLRVYIDREPTQKEALSNHTGAKHEPQYGCFLGAYLDLDTKLNRVYTDSTGKKRREPEQFEDLVGRAHATYFFYLGYGQRLPSDWVTSLAMRGKLVHIALEPNEGLDSVQDNDYLRALADDLAQTGARVFLRFGSEMNGPWTAYHGNPQKFRDKFKLVAKIMHQRAPLVAMVWAPLSYPEKPIPEYYPGDAAVDWVGVNIYSVTYFSQNPKLPAGKILPMKMLDFVYNRYSARKPVMVAEYGATNFSALEGVPQSEFASSRITMFYRALPRLYPRVKCINYFNTNNLDLSHRRNNNYAVTQDRKVLAAYRAAIQADYFLTAPYDSSSGLMGSAATIPIEKVDQPPVVMPAQLPTMPFPLKGSERLRGKIILSAWCKWQEGGVTLRYAIDGTTIAGCVSVNADVSLDANAIAPGAHVIVVVAQKGKKVLASRRIRVQVE